MMTSRDRVRSVFEGQIPDRVPMWCGMSPEFLEKSKKYLNTSDTEDVYMRFHDDFRRVFTRYVGPDLGETSIFGIEHKGIGVGQSVNRPLAGATLAQIEAYPWPDPDWIDISPIREQARQWDGRYAVLGGEWTPFFHDAVDLMGMENMMILMYEEPEIIHAVLDHIVDYYDAVNRRIFSEMKDVLDIYFFGNDFGSQRGPLIGKNLFEEFFAPHIKRVCATAHEFGLHTQMHCCGSYRMLMPSLIACGVESLQSLQPVTPDMQAEVLKPEIGSQVILNGGVNSIDVLIQGTREETRADTRRVLKAMMPGGKYILSASHDYILEETPVENVIEMFDTCLEEGVYHHSV